MLLIGYEYARARSEEWFSEMEANVAELEFEEDDIRIIIDDKAEEISRETGFTDNGITEDCDIPLSVEDYEDICELLSMIGTDVANDFFLEGINSYFNNNAYYLENRLYALMTQRSHLQCYCHQGIVERTSTPFSVSLDYEDEPTHDVPHYADLEWLLDEYTFDENAEDEIIEEDDFEYQHEWGIGVIPNLSYTPYSKFIQVPEVCRNAHDYILFVSVLDLIANDSEGNWILLDEIVAMYIANSIELGHKYAIFQEEELDFLEYRLMPLLERFGLDEKSSKDNIYDALLFNNFGEEKSMIEQIIRNSTAHLLSSWFNSEDDRELIHLSNRYPSASLYTYHYQRSFTDSCIVANRTDVEYIKQNHQVIRNWILVQWQNKKDNRSTSL